MILGKKDGWKITLERNEPGPTMTGTFSLPNHHQNFFDCIKTRAQPISDVYSHHRCASNCHMANIAMLLGRRLQWDPVKEAFLGDDQANDMRTRKQREGFEIDVV